MPFSKIFNECPELNAYVKKMYDTLNTLKDIQGPDIRIQKETMESNTNAPGGGRTSLEKTSKPFQSKQN